MTVESFHLQKAYTIIGSWSQPLEPGKQPAPSILSSNRHEAHSPLEYTKEDIAHIEKWGKPWIASFAFGNQWLTVCSSTSCRDNMAFFGNM